jgi:hypothetical protein
LAVLSRAAGKAPVRVPPYRARKVRPRTSPRALQRLPAVRPRRDHVSAVAGSRGNDGPPRSKAPILLAHRPIDPSAAGRHHGGRKENGTPRCRFFLPQAGSLYLPAGCDAGYRTRRDTFAYPPHGLFLLGTAGQGPRRRLPATPSVTCDGPLPGVILGQPRATASSTAPGLTPLTPPPPGLGRLVGPRFWARGSLPRDTYERIFSSKPEPFVRALCVSLRVLSSVRFRESVPES